MGQALAHILSLSRLHVISLWEMINSWSSKFMCSFLSLTLGTILSDERGCTLNFTCIIIRCCWLPIKVYLNLPPYCSCSLWIYCIICCACESCWKGYKQLFVPIKVKEVVLLQPFQDKFIMLGSDLQNDQIAVVFCRLGQVSLPHAQVLNLTIHRAHRKQLLTPHQLSFPPDMVYLCMFHA